jgi:hypothetical protein
MADKNFKKKPFYGVDSRADTSGGATLYSGAIDFCVGNATGD